MTTGGHLTTYRYLAVAHSLQTQQIGWRYPCDENGVTPNVWVAPEAAPLNEQVWQAWVAKGRAADERGREVRLKAAKIAVIVGLLSAAVLWSRAAPFEVLVRFMVGAGAIAVMVQSLRTRRYLFASVFASLAVLFNPIAPFFEFSGDWQRALLVACAAPFVASLAWRNVKVLA